MREISELFTNLNINKPVKPLVEQAFVHSSYHYENKDSHGTYERLEFIGDAVLELWTSNFLYKNKEFNEGNMTIVRSQFVCEGSLARLAKKLKLNDYIKLGIGEEKMGGRKRASILADVFEAFIGALYLEYGYEFTFKFLNRQLRNEVLRLKVDKGSKNELQELVQSDTREPLSYQLINSFGPPNNKTFEVVVYLDGIVLGKGSGKTKKIAEQMAAEDALKKMVR